MKIGPKQPQPTSRTGAAKPAKKSEQATSMLETSEKTTQMANRKLLTAIHSAQRTPSPTAKPAAKDAEQVARHVLHAAPAKRGRR